MTQIVGQFTMAALVMQGQHAQMFERDVTTYISQTSCLPHCHLNASHTRTQNKQTAISAHTRDTICSIIFNKTNAPEYI